MTSHLVEIYLDSYASERFTTVMDSDQSAQIDSCLSSWLEARTGHPIDLEQQLRVEDVSHPRINSTSAEHFVATKLRVKLVA